MSFKNFHSLIGEKIFFDVKIYFTSPSLNQLTIFMIDTS